MTDQPSLPPTGQSRSTSVPTMMPPEELPTATSRARHLEESHPTAIITDFNKMAEPTLLSRVPPGELTVTPQELVAPLFPGVASASLAGPVIKMGYSGALIAQLALQWPPDRPGPPSALIKYVDPSEALAGVPEPKRLRTIRSYTNEAAFLRGLAGRLAAAGVRIPALYLAETEPEPFRLLLVMEAATPEFAQMPAFDRPLSLASLGWLARFHAFGFELAEDRAALELWAHGGHTALPNRPAGELDGLPAGYARFRDAFSSASPELFRLPSERLGERLHSVAVEVDRLIGEAGWQTLSHGDFKAGNIFVQPGTELVCVIDWQWTGWNVPGQDLIYFLATAASDDCCDNWEQTLREYHQRFVAALSDELRQARKWGFGETVRLFKLATLDYMRWAISYKLPGETPEKVAERASAQPVDPNQGEYRRSLRRLSWLLQMVELFLPEAEAGSLAAPQCEIGA